MRERLLSVALSLMVIGCDTGSEERAARAPSVSVDSTPDTVTQIDSSPPSWIVRPDGIGPLRVGMTLADAARTLGEPLTVRSRGCDHVTPRNAPVGLRLMVVRDTVVRIEVDSAGIATVDSAQVGDSESRVLSLYGTRARIEPHKYTYPDGHYLVVAPPGDTVHRLIFETLNGRVTNYRAGRRPQVEWVEGCS
jgi:hypothetical protein